MATTISPLLIRKQIRVRGIVQGVGFRPFVYNLARELSLTGYVFNSSAGVRIEIEGTDESVQKFLDALQHRPPPLALIAEIAVADLDALGDDDFVIQAQPLGSRRVRPGVARYGDVRRVLARLRRPQEPPLRISFYQLHQLRTALHHHSGHSLRSPDDDHVIVSHVRRFARRNTMTRPTAASMPSRMRVPYAARLWRLRNRIGVFLEIWTITQRDLPRSSARRASCYAQEKSWP